MLFNKKESNKIKEDVIENEIGINPDKILKSDTSFVNFIEYKACINCRRIFDLENECNECPP